MNHFKGIFINNQWLNSPDFSESYERFSPATLDQPTLTLCWNQESVDQAVSSARKAFQSWKRTTQEERIEAVLRLRAEFAAKREDFARAIALETGKPLWEAFTEADALVAKIDIMTTQGLAETATVYPTQLPDGRYLFRPLGVLAVIAPFNFPVHLANGHLIPALLSGNTVVVKPSVLTSLSMQVYFECVEAAHFPDGVVNLVVGDGKIGQALVAHPDVNGILFTGSYQTGCAIQSAVSRHPGKMVALELGGKNTSIILPDANLDQATYEIAMASFLTTGQRCSATSRLAIHNDIADEMITRLCDIVDNLNIGHPLLEDPFMGSLTTESGFQHFLSMQQCDEDGALQEIRRGRKVRDDLNGFYVSPGLWRIHEVNPSGPHQGEEVFAPDICIYLFDRDEDAILFANATSYGLAMSIFTADEARFESMALDLETGVLNLNRSTCGASSRLPFGGIKNSGNHRPSAVLAGRYCTYPQAQLRHQATWDPANLSKGALAKIRKNQG